jgi:outer membrane receptor protein involved in Fe transport
MTRSRKRKLQRSRARWAVMPLASAVMAAAGAGHADQVESGTLEEIVVTAQKRTEDMQKVPISMQVLGGEKLEQLQVNSFDDYAKFLPSVSFQTLGPGQAELYFRGIASGGDGLHAGSASATGMYLDEIPVTTIGNSIDLHMYDIQRVEALAGPQGTLYGASSLSGTLRVITNKPDPTKFSAGYDVKGDKYGKGAGGGEFEGFVNIPLTDNMAVRLVGYYERDGGYISNTPATRTYTRQSTDPATYPDEPLTIHNNAFVKDNFNDVETYGGRAALKFDLNDSWSITPMVLYQHQQTNGTFGFDPLVGDLKVQDFEPDATLDHWYQTALTVEGKISNYDLVYSGGYFERNTSVASDYSEYSVAYDYYGYSRFRDNNGNLIDPTQAQLQTDRFTKMTHEIRLSSPATDRFRFTVGAFYQRQTDEIRDEYLINNLGSVAPYDFSVTGQANTLYLTQQTRVDRDYALFGDATFDMTDRLKLSAGIRGFVARNTLYGFFGFNDNFVDLDNGDNFVHSSGESSCINAPSVGGNLPCVNTDKGIRESGQTHRVNLTYQLDPDRMVYGTYSTGFRPGGNNRRVGLAPYTDDTLSNYELGWKTGWFDHRLRFNGAVFYEKWKDVQLGVTGPNAITDIWNIGNASVKGVESDIDWLVWDHLDVSASGTYVNARTTTAFCGEDLNVADKGTPAYGQLLPSCPGAPGTADGPSAPAGSRLPVTPEFKGNVTGRYRFSVGDYKSFAQASLLHQSSATSTIDSATESILGPTPAFTTVDFSAGTGAGNWNLVLYIENAFDKRGQLNRFGQCGATLCYEEPRIYPIKPQNFGVKFGQKF